ncbi:GntR family transcriptional regulator [Blastococcus tunisiensis]|uniref:DNA-binding transcriptional regulator, GntR family n=1 Tax=Blastococcus tunisiensis TaxID=1798228 RepID=A0A1I2JPL5_9ACTN|nr:GntR family transcriptional regulator [Blastococcus sp. DSM 46838]SFF54631.1 DNA-binding transcriptional regulator, GntR family [Blastococcus sp. DSM 46838]
MAYGSIKEALLDGRWPAGERLPLTTLKADLGMSKQPIMEALRRLDADGLVEIVPQVGCRVLRYDMDQMTDFFTVFASLEGAATAVAASRRKDVDLARLEAVHRRIDALRDDPDEARRGHEYRTLNRTFHSVIHDMTRSDIVRDMSLRMWDLSDFLINTAGLPAPMGSALERRHCEHQQIYDALVAGDVAAARSRTEQHVLNNVDLIRGQQDELPRTRIPTS